jgi:hypothetical protein
MQVPPLVVHVQPFEALKHECTSIAIPCRLQHPQLQLYLVTLTAWDSGAYEGWFLELICGRATKGKHVLCCVRPLCMMPARQSSVVCPLMGLELTRLHRMQSVVASVALPRPTSCRLAAECRPHTRCRSRRGSSTHLDCQ